jgi:large subunit ribosomal protein L32e
MIEEYSRMVYTRSKEIKMVNPRKKPKFLRQGTTYRKSVSKVWRRPRGTHTKLKVMEKNKGFMPNVGYGAPRKTRYLHPSGLREVLIQNLKDLEKIDKEKEAVMISHTIGEKKRKFIVDKANELKIKILNP